MTTYLVPGATGLIGRHVVARLLERPDAEIFALVRESSKDKLAARRDEWDGGERVTPLVGDLGAPMLGLSAARRRRLKGVVDHVVHLAAIYDMTADEETNQRANVDGTRHVVELADEIGAGCLHHVSSVAVAGDHKGRFDEGDFDLGQDLPSPYHATKFEAERVVRDEATVPWRVYRPAIVVGDSRTGEMDKIDGPYYFFPTIARLRSLPSWLPLIGPDLGDTNLVPVDFVADAMVHLIHVPGRDGEAFHLVAPEPIPFTEVYNAFAEAARVPAIRVPIDRRLVAPVEAALGALAQVPGVAPARDAAFGLLGVPPEVLPHSTFPSVFGSEATQEALTGSGISVPPIGSYAQKLWDYWAAHLDPDRARRPRPGGPLQGRTVIVTGASSGIGRATALGIAERGGIPLLVARRTDALEELRAEIEAAGGEAHVYSCDLTKQDSVDTTIKQMLADHDGIDMLVNNAGRSIRRSVKLSTDRLHDYERTMTLNYFGPVRLILALLPHMAERRFGHIVNVSSIGVQANPPRFSAYVASKSALDSFSRVVASETYGDGITFTTVHMPLVRTPMIKPTKIYDYFPTLTPEQAADLVLHALERRPKHVGTPLGTLAEVSYSLAPKMVDAVLHQAYKVFPDSTAAKGKGPDKQGAEPDRADADGGADEEVTLSMSARVMSRLLRGVHW